MRAVLKPGICDLPPRDTLDTQSRRPSKPKVAAAGGPLAPVVIGVWLVLVIAVFALIENTTHGPREQGEFKSLAIVGLLVGLTIVLVVIDWLRKPRRPGGDPDSDA